MIDSRDMKELHPRVRTMAELFIKRVAEELAYLGCTIKVISTLRDYEFQDSLYKIGRTVKGEGVSAKLPMGRIVTKAKGGQSFHNFRIAFDVMVLRNGKPVWTMYGDGIDDNPNDDLKDDLELWQRVGKIGVECGLEWAGNWKGFKEYAHFQHCGGLTLKDFQSGKMIPG